jgi:hypothetical protein
LVIVGLENLEDFGVFWQIFWLFFDMMIQKKNWKIIPQVLLGLPSPTCCAGRLERLNN